MIDTTETCDDASVCTSPMHAESGTASAAEETQVLHSDNEKHAVTASNPHQNCNHLHMLSKHELNELAQTLIPLLSKQYVIPKINSKTDDIYKQMKQLQKSNDRLINMNKGLREQLNTWVKKVNEIQTKLNKLEAKEHTEAKQIKSGLNKIPDLTKTQQKLKASLKKIEDDKATCNERINQLFQTIDAMKHTKEDVAATTNEVQLSQNFMNTNYEELKVQNEEIKNQLATSLKNFGEINEQVKQLSEGIILTHEKAENNAKYSRSDSLQVNGIPESLFKDCFTESENCKNILVGLCKELNFILNPETISTAHRLKKNENAKGPRGIIVRFLNRDARNDVYNLRKQCKEKTDWKMEGISKVFINESLTPEKRKLLFDTKRAVNDKMFDKHGIIYVWTYKGNIFVRKAAESAPKVMVRSNLDLFNIVKGFTSLDNATDDENSVNYDINKVYKHWIKNKSPWRSNLSSVDTSNRYNGFSI